MKIKNIIYITWYIIIASILGFSLAMLWFNPILALIICIILTFVILDVVDSYSNVKERENRRVNKCEENSNRNEMV